MVVDWVFKGWQYIKQTHICIHILPWDSELIDVTFTANYIYSLVKCYKYNSKYSESGAVYIIMNVSIEDMPLRQINKQ